MRVSDMERLSRLDRNSPNELIPEPSVQQTGGRLLRERGRRGANDGTIFPDVEDSHASVV
jgi:hypothetical protein